MAHHTLKSGYSALVERLNRHPQGAHESELLFKILKLLFSEEDAGRVAQLPFSPFTVDTASKIWKTTQAKSHRILNDLADRAILLDIDRDGQSVYVLPPPMAGFFEFSLMRVRGDIDQKLLSELLYNYLNVEEDFIKDLFTQGMTHLGRTFVHEPSLSEENALHVLDYERASEVIKTASHRGIGTCYCRHKMKHLGKACHAPLEICMTFNTTAASLIKHNYIRSVDRVECLDLLQEAYERKLVQFGENIRERVNFICNCCGCCCEAMLAAKRFAILNPVHTTNFMPVVDPNRCTGCGACIATCPVNAMTRVPVAGANQPDAYIANVNEDICLGCGVCVRSCTKRCIHLDSRSKRVLTPLNITHRLVEMAIERGTLQDIIFDNKALWSHRAMAGILGVILKLPPVKQLLACEQVKSRYLEMLLRRKE